MGVSGLMSFVRDNNGSLTAAHQLRDTELVLDGNNLIYQIFQRAHLQWAFGGDYDLYAQAVRKFFSNLRACNISCLVIFDGCYDPNGIKLKTTMQRAAQRLHVCRRFNHGRLSGLLLPASAPEVFVSVLDELGIRHITGPSEADLNIAAYAHQHKCPVTSFDSDFYIFDLPAGYIPLDSLDSHVSTVTCECCPGGQHHFMSCSIYFRSELRFPRLEGDFDPEFLPLLATLMGNDFTGKALDEFFAKVRLPKPSRCVSKKHCRTESLLLWLRRFDRPEAAVRGVLAHVREERRTDVERLIESSLNQYRLDRAWIHARPQPDFLPADLCESFQCRRLLPVFANAAACSYVFLLPTAEDLRLDSVFDASREVRGWMYAALQCTAPVLEYCRRKRDLCKTKVPPDAAPPFSNLQEALATLGIRCPLLQSSLGDLVLLLCFWFARSAPSLLHLTALLLSVLCNLERFESSELCAALDSQGEETPSEEGEKKVRKQRLAKFLETPAVNNAKPLDLVAVHQFSAFNAVLQVFTQFSTVSPSFSFSIPPISTMLSGRLYYNLHSNLRRRSEESLFIQELLGRQSRLNSWFWTIRAQIAEIREEMK